MIESSRVTDTESRGTPSTDFQKRRSPVLATLFMLAAGAVLIAGLSGCKSVLGALSGRRSASGGMVTVHQSKYQDVDQTCDALKPAIEAQGFGFKGILNLNNAMAKHGVHLDRQVRVVQFGRAVSAREMLKDYPAASAFMPCRFGVYEGDDGRVHISEMNRGCIGKMLGGTMATVMGGQVAEDLRKALRDHVK